MATELLADTEDSDSVTLGPLCNNDKQSDTNEASSWTPVPSLSASYSMPQPWISLCNDDEQSDTDEPEPSTPEPSISTSSLWKSGEYGSESENVALEFVWCAEGRQQYFQWR